MRSREKIFEEFPFYLNQVTGVTTEEISGWGNGNFGVKEKEKVSKELATYLNYIKNKLQDLKISIVSVGTGPNREHSFNWDD